MKYKVGDRLMVERRIYDVIDIINQGESKDMRIQGPRYLLSGSGVPLSITENELLSKRVKILNKINTPISKNGQGGVSNG